MIEAQGIFEDQNETKRTINEVSRFTAKDGKEYVEFKTSVGNPVYLEAELELLGEGDLKAGIELVKDAFRKSESGPGDPRPLNEEIKSLQEAQNQA